MEPKGAERGSVTSPGHTATRGQCRNSRSHCQTPNCSLSTTFKDHSVYYNTEQVKKRDLSPSFNAWVHTFLTKKDLTNQKDFFPQHHCFNDNVINLQYQQMNRKKICFSYIQKSRLCNRFCSDTAPWRYGGKMTISVECPVMIV